MVRRVGGGSARRPARGEGRRVGTREGVVLVGLHQGGSAEATAAAADTAQGRWSRNVGVVALVSAVGAVVTLVSSMTAAVVTLVSSMVSAAAMMMGRRVVALVSSAKAAAVVVSGAIVVAVSAAALGLAVAHEAAVGHGRRLGRAVLVVAIDVVSGMIGVVAAIVVQPPAATLVSVTLVLVALMAAVVRRTLLQAKPSKRGR
mmetsp:Transcript_6423/g.14157  ORF Transcript_6423/g.14157 Transcript_6423/m.14157 type:complete len:202 (-) Transcript_6423:1050-1655(-)